ncbi:hypothetical protein COD46_05010 [Escherichia coli]|nr:hypothetical protein COD46_05010 [Escherichia coli]
MPELIHSDKNLSVQEIKMIKRTLLAAAIFSALPAYGNDSNLLIVFYVQIMPDDFVMQLHRF